MSSHTSRINWQRAVHPLDNATYNRNHIATLSGNQTVAVSASEEFKGDPACADPEQMLVSAVSSCHMLFFLAIAERQGVTVESYEDRAIGHLEKGPSGAPIITRVELHPDIVYGGEQRPDAATIDRIHAAAHKSCFIGNSITADVVVHDRSRA
jgi:organic hydroperoxide reductase OsmC/OhrA